MSGLSCKKCPWCGDWVALSDPCPKPPAWTPASYDPDADEIDTEAACLHYGSPDPESFVAAQWMLAEVDAGRNPFRKQ